MIPEVRIFPKSKPAYPERMASNRYVTIFLFLAIWVGCIALKHPVYDDPERESWQRPEQVIQALGIQPGGRVADLGSGSGYFTLRLARAVGPAGKVYAVDVDPSMNEYVAERTREEGQKNIEIILAEHHDPLLPESGVDLIFSVNVYHHLENRSNYFRNVRKYLRPRGRVAIIDFKKEAFHHFTPREVIRTEMKAAGYHLQQEYKFLPRQHFLIFSKQAE